LTRETSLPRVAVLILLGALAATVVLIAISGRGASAAVRAVHEDASVQASSTNATGDLAARQTLRRYAGDTWDSFVAMTDPETGLPADSLSVEGERSVQTSTTNIGAYMWSTVVAEKLGIIGHREAVARLSRTIGTLEGMERHEPSGQFYNWYDARTGRSLRTGRRRASPSPPYCLP
jgi:hypothetical protein